MVLLSFCCAASVAVAGEGAQAAPAAVDSEMILDAQDADPTNVNTFAQDEKSSEDIVDNLRDEFLQAKNIPLGLQGGNSTKHFFWGSAMTNAPVTAPDFGKYRAMAFDAAYANALESFARATGERVKSDVVKKVFENSSTNAAEFDEELKSGKSKVGAIVDKILAAGEGFLDSKLTEMGIDPDQYKSVPPDQKKVLLSDAITKKIVRECVKSLSGVTVFQTFVGEGSDGLQTVGVLIMYSSKLQAIADTLKKGQEPLMRVQGKPLARQIPNDPQKLYDMFGTKVLFDENGVVIVAYSQWSNSYKGTDARIRSRSREAAVKQADANASAQISAFLNSHFSGTTQDETGTAIESAIIKRGSDGSQEESVSNSIISIHQEQSRIKSSAYLQGVSTYKTWKYRTEDGHEVVGVVKTYSFGSMQAAKDALKVKRAKSHYNSPAPTTEHRTDGRMGEEQMDMDVF